MGSRGRGWAACAAVAITNCGGRVLHGQGAAPCRSPHKHVTFVLMTARIPSRLRFSSTIQLVHRKLFTARSPQAHADTPSQTQLFRPHIPPATITRKSPLSPGRKQGCGSHHT